MNQNGWVKTHSWLQPLASLQAHINAEIAEIPIARPAIPEWQGYADDFHAGLPLLHSPEVRIDLEPVEKCIASLVEKLAVSALPYHLAEDSKILNGELSRTPGGPCAAVGWLLYDASPFTTSVPGFLRYIGWKALSLYLAPLVHAFGKWRDEERWLRSYCPTCGSLPGMAQLAGKEPGRRRFLSCGCCGTRWWYRRTGCPFCDSQNDHQLAVLTIEGEPALRIDHCASCSGYLKTYDGEGQESVLLADWTSIHLDMIAQDRGLKRLATSLYRL
jgi:FdhE protein